MSINVQKAEFILSAASPKDFRRDALPQVAFAGRSNVGKSSVINRLLNRKNFARVGAAPGKTTQINYFKIDNAFYLVDLPGYGYARVSKGERDRWGRLMEGYFADPELYEKNMDWYKAEISKCTYRQFTTGFYFGKPDENTQIYDNNTYVNEYIYLGIVEAVKDSLCRIEQRNKFCVGDSIEIMKPDGTNVPVTVEAMYTEEGESVDSAPHPKQVLWIKLSMPPQAFDLLRQKNAD